MPLFDYSCNACDHQFEVLQGVNDAPLTDCPECGKSTLKKLVSAPAFTFKGSGWYKDLYGSASSGSKSETTTTGNSSSESTTKPATEGKPSASSTTDTSKPTS